MTRAIWAAIAALLVAIGMLGWQAWDLHRKVDRLEEAPPVYSADLVRQAFQATSKRIVTLEGEVDCLRRLVNPDTYALRRPDSC